MRDSRSEKDGTYIREGDVLEVADVKQTELDQVKELGLNWELALYRKGNDFETQDRVIIIFQQTCSYAVPKMFENLHQMSQDGEGNSIPLHNFKEESLQKLNNCFSCLCY